MDTKYLSGSEVLKFRDEAWHKYFSNEKYLSLIESKFGIQNRKNIEEQSKIRLDRKYYWRYINLEYSTISDEYLSTIAFLYEGKIDLASLNW